MNKVIFLIIASVISISVLWPILGLQEGIFSSASIIATIAWGLFKK